MDWNASCFPLLDRRSNTRRLGISRRIEVEVVDVQLRVRVSRSRSFECNGDEALAEHVIKDVAFQLTVFTENLVDDVPGVDLAFVSCHFRRDVRLQD